jgi:outer membrane protein assembly factor BamB
MPPHTHSRACQLLWLTLLCLLLSACAPLGDERPAATSTPIARPAPTATSAALPTATPEPPVAQAAARPAADTCLARGPFPPALSGLRYGVNAFLFGTDQERVLTLGRQAGFGWLRHQIHWRDIELRPGRYDWGALDLALDAARRHDLRVLLSVVRSPAWATAQGHAGLPDDPQALGSFMGALAARYAGTVHAYQVWNEPNLAVESGGRVPKPATYLAALQSSYTAIRQADPCALVLAAPLAATATEDPAIAADDLRFYRELYALDDGAFLRAADVVALHPGGGDQPFDARWPSEDPARSRFYFRHIEEIRALMEQAGDRRQVWITEVGWSTTRAAGAPPPVSPAQQAENLVGALRLTRADYPWVTAIFVWNLNFAVLGPADDEKSTFGILRPDWSPQPAYLALQSYLNAQAEADRQSMARFEGDAPYLQRWQFAAGAKVHTAPALAADGTIYISTDPGRFFAISPSGGLRWTFDAPGGARSAPALASDGTLYLGDESGHLTALRPDGTLLWQQSFGSAIRGTPQLDRDALYVVTKGGEVLRLDLAGAVIWRVALGATGAPALLAPGGNSSPGILYVPTAAGDLLALTDAGEQHWRAAIGRPLTSAPVLSSAEGADRRILIGDAEGYLNSLDAATGLIRWQRKLVQRIESPSLPATSALITAPPLVGADGTIYQGGRDGTLTAIDRDGEPLWRYDSGSDISISPVFARDGTICIGLYAEELRALDQDGRLRWRAYVRGAVRSLPSADPDGTLYISTVGGMLYAFEPLDED